MNNVLKKVTSGVLVTVMIFALTVYGNTTSALNTKAKPSPLIGMTAPGDPTNIPQTLQIDWNKRYRYAELEDQLRAMATEASNITELYSIGTSWQERDLWCLEITNESIPASKKIGIGIFANIHGGERESASSAMYTAWWTVLNRSSKYVNTMLNNYILYVIPVINPDGYEQSFINNNRPNLRPTDRNGNRIPFSDPYTDIDGDGYIATLYRGVAGTQPTTNVKAFGTESPDWDKNGILGDDPRSSLIDMNRTFNYQWNRYDIETDVDGKKVIGNNSWASAGPDAASEPEIKAVQNFLAQKPMMALTTMHTGIQCVLYPWCYRSYDANNPDDAEIPFMKDTAVKMAAQFQKTTGRGFYTMSSYQDYPTAAEMIDYAYGVHNIHAYTIEVYSGGKSGNIKDCMWENTLPTPKWVFYSQADLKIKLGLDVAKLKDQAGKPLAENEGLWFYTSSTAQMVNKAPEDQDIMVKGAKDAILTMIESEPNGAGYKMPFFLK